MSLLVSSPLDKFSCSRTRTRLQVAGPLIPNRHSLAQTSFAAKIHLGAHYIH